MAARSNTGPPTGDGDLSIDPDRAVLVGTPLSILALAAVWAPHRLLHHEDALKALFRALGPWWFGPALLAGIILHELQHAAAWRVAGRLGPGAIRFGVNWRVLMPYAHPTAPMSAHAYALGAAAPGLLLGLAPAIAGLVLGNGALSGWGAIFLAAAAGDAMVLYSLRSVDRRAMVRDHPVRVGCEVLPATDR